MTESGRMWDQYRDVLLEVPLLVQLKDEELKALEEIGEVMSLAAGETIFSEGDVGDSLFIILDGAVEIARTTEACGAPVRLAALRRADFFGEMSLIDIEPRSARATTTQPTTLFRIDHDRMRELVGAEGRSELLLILMTNLARTLSRRLRDTNARLT